MNIEDNKQNKKIFFIFWIYTLIVIFWGAWVRISHSGDGCGDHWPLCTGEFIPDFTHQKTFIEYFHRIMSGAYGIIVLYFFFKLKKHLRLEIRKLNSALLGLMISEALLGALLVKLKLVSVDDSYLRLLFMSLHQLNSFMLTGVTYLLYKSFDPEFKFQFSQKMILFLMVSVSGAIASLSTTLFPTISLFQGILADLNQASHPFIKLRIVHPLLALSIMTGFIIWLHIKNQMRLALEILFAMCIGIITLITLSPVPLKIIHLGIAHVLWARFLSVKWKAHLIQKAGVNT